MTQARMKFFGWGREGEGLTREEDAFFVQVYQRRFGVTAFDTIPAPTLDTIRMRAPRLTPPAALADLCASDTHDRAVHAFGKSLPDEVRAMQNDFSSAPDVVVRPRTEQDVAAAMDWAGSAGAILVPFGGGSSACGGVTPPSDIGRFKGVISLDLGRLDKVLEIDRTSRAARIQAGVYGPALENQLRPHGLTLRHFPQSFQYSSLGGWIATRSGGHFASLYTHIDDFVESLRVVTPKGTLETRRLPGSGAGPSPDRMFIGSEGILGVITEAWMRLQDRPRFRAGGAVRFKDFFTAARALRVISQAGLYPANCRVLDPGQALDSGAADGSVAVMVLAFESADHPLDAWMARALEICADFGGVPEAAGKRDAHREGAAEQWRTAFIRMPYARELMALRGVISATVETAITWERFEALHDAVKSATERTIKQVTGRSGEVTCRFTHVYPDGPAPYFTFHALGRHGAMAEQFEAIRAAAADAIIAGGGTITHHHAVGREHRPWYDRQRPDLFAAALTAAKRALDPQGMLNPGVLIDP